LGLGWLLGFTIRPRIKRIKYAKLVRPSRDGSYPTLDTGSIWPALVAHAPWNAIINGGFSLATQGEDAKRWIGGSGLLVVFVLVGVTLAIGWVPAERQPGAS
jgi:hypothetical protein